MPSSRSCGQNRIRWTTRLPWRRPMRSFWRLWGGSKMKWVFGIVGGAFLVAGALGVRGALHMKGPSSVDPALVVKVKRADLDVMVQETGKIEPKAKADIKSKVAGQVVHVYVKEGETVKAGQKLIQLDPTDYRREV